MITEIEIENLKSLEKVRLKLGKLNLFVGTNASGKSNFLEALRVFQGIGYGFSIDEILNGKPKSAGSEAWEGIRGGSARAKFLNSSGESKSDSISLSVGLRAPGGSHDFCYFIQVDPDYGAIKSEGLKLGSRTLFEKTPDTSKWSDFYHIIEHRHKKGKPALTPLDFLALVEGVQETELKACIRILSNMQRLSPEPEILRDYGQVFLAKRMGESGENFASLVQAILKDKGNKEAYQSWLRELVPIEVEEVKILPGADGEPLFALRHGNLEFSARVLSDGTLRFAALAAAFFQPDMPDVITIEEIENGIHPSRLRLLVELLKSQSSEDGPQVFATTHSPVVLAWLQEEDYATTFFCRRDEETGASIIKPLSEIPHLVELVKKHPLGELFTEGWMETVR